ncbi:MAG TPA: hypothetical protein P5117_02385, partial [Spirochaetia bacterium]|nr:hypothetical protein [Spirochaetia bacterium]
MQEFMTLEAESLQVVYAVFMEAFSDYSVPVTWSFEEFRASCLRRGVDLSISLGAREDGRLVGFVLNGRGTWGGMPAAYDAGTGVGFREAEEAGLVEKDRLAQLLRGKRTRSLEPEARDREAGPLARLERDRPAVLLQALGGLDGDVEVAALGHPLRGDAREAVHDAFRQGDVAPLPGGAHLPHHGPVDPLPLELLARAEIELQGDRAGEAVPRGLLDDLERRPLPPERAEASLLLSQAGVELLAVEPGELRVEPEVEDLAEGREARQEGKVSEVGREGVEAGERRLHEGERDLGGPLPVRLAERDRDLGSG